MAVTGNQIAELLSSLDVSDETALELACELHRAREVEPLGAELSDAPAGSFAYHLKDAAASRRLGECALLDGSLARRNGVVMGSGHRDLRCSYRSCGFSVCPVALAACFSLHEALLPKREVPLFGREERRRLDRERRGREFVEKWSERTVDSERALRLLVSEQENDFAGMVVADDDSYRADFVSDVAALLAALGKIDRGSIRHVRAVSLMQRVDQEKFTFKATGDENLEPRVLYVIDRLGDFVSYEGARMLKDYVIERLSRIVNDRYVLLVGTRAELMRFAGLSAAFHFTYEQNCIELGYMTSERVFEHYLANLDEPLRLEAAADPGFRERFCSFVGFNADALPFKGRELADYLAKGSNAAGRLELPRSRYQSSSLEEMLDEIVGLEDVKETVRKLERFAVFRKTAEGRGAKLPPANFHMLFTGNPGTGKTTVARMVATMLYKIGITKQNLFKEVTAKDLIGEYVGHTAPKTAAVVGEAIGGVLFIDEAYALAGGKGRVTGADYGAEAVAELIKIMEDHRDDLVVIFAGYEREMADFIDSNPGISSRIGYKFRFEDYSTDELLQIFRKNLAASGFDYDRDEVDPVLRRTFDYHRRFRSFGNGRFVGTLVQKAIIKRADRAAREGASAEGAMRLSLEDIPTRQELFDIQDWEPRAAEELLEPLVGMEELKERVCEFERVVSFHERGNRSGLRMPPMNLHMVFTGNPGTGKTTVARIIGQILYNVGVIPTNRFVEVEAKDLTSSIVGGSSGATEEKIEEAVGGVLFIDEAYGLLETHDGAEVIAQLVKAMEDHKGELSVMFAGYKTEMQRFIELNPGLASRVGYTFHFDDYDTDELEEIFERKMAGYGFSLDDEAKAATRKIFQYFHNVENFGNGRFVDKVVQEVIAKRSEGDSDDLAAITAHDVPAIKDLCEIVSMPVLSPDDDFSDDSLRRVAIHEMGHATCRLALVGETNIVVVTVEREASGSLGYVQHKTGGAAMPTASHFENRIAELMGGMAAESLYFGDYSAGNSSDLQQATALARDYVARYGMSPAGYVQYVGDARASVDQAEIVELPREVRDEMNRVMASSFERAKEVIEAHRPVFDRLVEVLLAEQTISGERIMALWDELSEKEAPHEQG